jgi:hypothetical protein
MATVRDAVHGDCLDLAPRLRAEDVEEVWASSRSTPLAALLSGLVYSTYCWTILNHEGEIVGMFGVAPIAGSSVGSPWLLCSEGLVGIQREFIRQCPAWIDRMHEDYTVLSNLADTRNVVHLKWLRRCGFDFMSTVTINDNEFVQFMKVKE